MQILVTGGSGSLASVVLQTLVQDGHRLFTVGSPRYSHTQIVTASSFRSLGLDFRTLDAIVDLAGPAPSHPLPRPQLQAYLDDSRNLLRSALAAGVPRIIHVSTVRSARSKHPFVSLKSEQEEMIKNSGIPYVIFRAPWIIGPRDLFLRPLIDQIRQGKQAQLQDLSETLVQMVSQKDMARAISMALVQRSTYSRAYDIASFPAIRLGDLYQYLLELLSFRCQETVELPWSETQRSLVREEGVGTPTAACLDFRFTLRSVRTGLLELLSEGTV
jgi:nucleoside-diphosphate-sugar epimerase